MSEASNTRERLLEIALELLASRGADKLTIRDIASRADISLSVVYHHFKNKQALLDACKLDFYARLEAMSTGVIGELVGRERGEAIRLAVATFWRFARDNVEVLRLLAADVITAGKLIDEVHGYHRRPMFAAAVAALAPKLGLDVPTLRLRIQCIGVLVTRFAVSDDAELVAVLGEVSGPIDDAVERHLADAAVRSLTG